MTIRKAVLQSPFLTYFICRIIGPLGDKCPRFRYRVLDIALSIRHCCDDTEWLPEIAFNSWITLRETLVGFILALILSVPLAIVLAFTRLHVAFFIRSCWGCSRFQRGAGAAGDLMAWRRQLAEDRHRNLGMLFPDPD